MYYYYLEDHPVDVRVDLSVSGFLVLCRPAGFEDSVNNNLDELR